MNFLLLLLQDLPLRHQLGVFKLLESGHDQAAEALVNALIDLRRVDEHDITFVLQARADASTSE